MVAFLVGYDGSWMNGRAVVIAESAEQAAELVRADRRTTNFQKVTVEPIGAVTAPAVLFNWDGDY